MALIGQAVSEKKIFENGGRRTDDGRTPDHGHPISSPCEPNGSGELKRARSLKFRIKIGEELYYPSSENKGADQLCSYCEADLRLCFHLCRLLVFP